MNMWWLVMQTTKVRDGNVDLMHKIGVAKMYVENMKKEVRGALRGAPNVDLPLMLFAWVVLVIGGGMLQYALVHDKVGHPEAATTTGDVEDSKGGETGEAGGAGDTSAAESGDDVDSRYEDFDDVLQDLLSDGEDITWGDSDFGSGSEAEGPASPASSTDSDSGSSDSSGSDSDSGSGSSGSESGDSDSDSASSAASSRGSGRVGAPSTARSSRRSSRSSRRSSSDDSSASEEVRAQLVWGQVDNVGCVCLCVGRRECYGNFRGLDMNAACRAVL